MQRTSDYFFFETESVHRLRHPSQAAGALHAERDRQSKVQDLAGGRVDAVRVLHYDAHRAQHHPSDDESELRMRLYLLCFWLREVALYLTKPVEVDGNSFHIQEGKGQDRVQNCRVHMSLWPLFPCVIWFKYSLHYLRHFRVVLPADR